MKEFKLYVHHDHVYHPLLAKYSSYWPTRLDLDPSYHYHIDLRPEVKGWLDGVVGNGWTRHISIAWNIRNKVKSTPYMVDMVLGFHDPGMAVLFKLRWM